MHRFRRWFAYGALGLLAPPGIIVAQPALTTIQDILYRADGTRFSGTMFITYNSFEAGDTSNVAPANLRVPVVNGVLNVQLVPTTTASAGAQYNITYNSRGINQFTETWAVPPSTVPLQVAAIRLSAGTVVGPADVTTATTIQISNVADLANELANRPLEGVGFAIGKTAIINDSGQIDGASGNLSDCVHVDGSSGPCGSGGSGVLPSFSDEETPAGTINGTNPTFTLAFAPSPASAVSLYLNGLLMTQGVDYSISGNIITFLQASTPQTGDLLTASYRYANANNPLGSLTTPQVICSSNGTSTTATTQTQLGSCTIPAGLLGTGDRIEVQFQFAHSGSATGFTGTILWAGTALLTRTAPAAETGLVGRMTFGISPGTQSWDAQSWGTNLTLASAVGSGSANTTLNLTIAFDGQMAAATSDAVILNNFTVIRYPAQINP